MFKHISLILAIGFLLIGVGMPGAVMAGEEEGSVIVDVDGDGAPDTVLVSPTQDITPFLRSHGYTDEKMQILKKVNGYTEDATPITSDADDELTECKH